MSSPRLGPVELDLDRYTRLVGTEGSIDVYIEDGLLEKERYRLFFVYEAAKDAGVAPAPYGSPYPLPGT